MTRRSLPIGLLILALAAGTTWLSRQTRQEAAPVAASSAPDYFINGLTAVETGPDGRPTQRLRADTLVHFPTRAALVQQPHLTVYQAGDAPPWELTAHQATVEEDGKLVLLTGGVRALRPGPEPTEIQTQSLRVRPERHYAETADPVTLTDPLGTIKAVGMEAFMAEKRVILRSQVRGTYER